MKLLALLRRRSAVSGKNAHSTGESVSYEQAEKENEQRMAQALAKWERVLFEETVGIAKAQRRVANTARRRASSCGHTTTAGSTLLRRINSEEVELRRALQVIATIEGMEVGVRVDFHERQP
jgi:hypothetical protein